LQVDDLSADLLANNSGGPGSAGLAVAADIRSARIRVGYLRNHESGAPASSPAELLGAVRFGMAARTAEAQRSDSAPTANRDLRAASSCSQGIPRGQPLTASGMTPLTIDVQLEPLHGPAAELWFANGPVHSGQSGIVRYAHDDHYLLAVVDEDERSHGGIGAAAEAVYSAMRRFQQRSRFSQLLRMWNYLDAINEGAGDRERYRQFCVGRAQGMGEVASGHYPAATAIGRQHRTHQLQVYWLAGRAAGTAVENPRQLSAYNYPREHGPVSPSFSRAVVAPDHTVLISGTASIVGHVSQHPGHPLAQLEETLRNLGALTSHARQPGAASRQDLLKVYLRDPALLEPVRARLQQTHPDCEVVFLAGDICRQELLLEIECIRGSG
jgi:chorismate lyase/3-hydroxybenzoate synthase